MSRGLGHVERALLAHFGAIVSDQYLTTHDLCGLAYNLSGAPTKAQRVSVLRAMRRLTDQEGPLPGWRIESSHTRRGWFLWAPVIEAPKKNTCDDELLGKLLGMLDSAHPGERENAARLAGQHLRSRGLTWGGCPRYPW